MKKGCNEVTMDAIYDSMEGVRETLGKVYNEAQTLLKCMTELSDGVSPISDFRAGIIKTAGYDKFYKNMMNCRLSEKQYINVFFLLNYVSGTEENRKQLFGYIKDTIGITTPITKRRIKNPNPSSEEKQNLEPEQLDDIYVRNLTEIFDCYREIITYNSYIMPIDVKNKSEVIKVAREMTQAIYNLVKDDIRIRLYSKNCYEQLGIIIDTCNKTNNKSIKLKNPEEFFEDLNKNIFLNDDIESLYGDLVRSYVDYYNNKIACLEIKDFSEELIEGLKKKGLDNSEEMLNKVSERMKRKLKKCDSEFFCRGLESLLDKEADLAWKGDSYNYWRAINGLSADCSIMLHKMGIYCDSEKNKEVLESLEKAV